MRILFLFLLLPSFVIAQCYDRYKQEIFSTISTSSDLQYGQTLDYNNDTLNLYVDLHEPQGDTLSKRPLLILLHGDNFVNGSKTDSSLMILTNNLVKRGFLVANIDYRKVFSMQFLLDEENLFLAMLRASQDAKAALRYFRHTIQNGNPHKIDSNMIWLAGIGSGSMLAQMAVYLDDSLEVSTAWSNIIQTEGGLDGNSNSYTTSSQVRGLINISGATLDTAWMSNNTVPILNIHGDLDTYYPYDYNRLFAYTHNQTCNGHHELCYKRLNEVTFVQTHNSHAHDGDFSILAANQDGDIPAQLSAGVRGLGIKLYYTSSLFCSGGTDLYAYHGDPFLGCVKFSDIGNQILSFLNNNPNEFLFITVEGSASNAEIADGFDAAGLTPFLYQHTFGETWPTLGELIDSDQRIIVMTSNSGNQLPGYHHMWTFIQDTEYNFQSTNGFNCNYLRGNQNADLFLLNHFLTIGSPQPLSAASTNDWQLVLDRARQCSAARGLHPNLLYIDFFDSGDVFRAADSLNRIGADFPYVQGSYLIQQQAQQLGQFSQLITLNNENYAPQSNLWEDSTAQYIADFLIEYFPCELSCAPPVTSIIGLDSILQNVDYVYTIDYHHVSSYTWLTTDSTYLDMDSIWVNTDQNSMQLFVIETSQFGCVYDTLEKTILAFPNVSVQTLSSELNVKVYPNPASGTLFLELPEQFDVNTKLEVYNLKGELVLNPQFSTHSINLIDIQSLENGVYFLKVLGNELISIPFIKME